MTLEVVVGDASGHMVSCVAFADARRSFCSGRVTSEADHHCITRSPSTAVLTSFSPWDFNSYEVQVTTISSFAKRPRLVQRESILTDIG